MEPGLRSRFVSEMCLRGHLTLQTTLHLGSLAPKELGAMARSLCRDLRSGERPGQLREIMYFNAQASTVEEVCQAFWSLFPNGPDLQMLGMAMDQEDFPSLFDPLYDRMQPTTNDKATLLNMALQKKKLALALDLFGEVQAQADLTCWDYQKLTMYYIQEGEPNLTLLETLVEVPLRFDITINPEEYLFALVSRGYEKAALLVWQLMGRYEAWVFNPDLLQRRAIANSCLEFAVELAPYARHQASYDWTTELAGAAVPASTALKFVEALAEIDGRLQGEYRQLLAREVKCHLYGAVFLERLLELAARYDWVPPYEALATMLLAFQAPKEYLAILSQQGLSILTPDTQARLEAYLGRD